MNIRLTLFVVALGTLGSCATYKQGQTPDDVYFSPDRSTEQYVVVDQRSNNRYDPNQYEDMRLRQSIRDPRLRNMDAFNDDMLWRNNAFNMWNPMWGNSWNNPWMWNAWGLNSIGMGWNNVGWNNFGWNNMGWNNWGWNNRPMMMFPGVGTPIMISPSKMPMNNTGIRFSPGIQNFNNGANMNASPKSGNARGNSRYFSSGSNGERRSNSTFSNFFGGSSNSSYQSGSSGGSRSFSTERSFNSGSSSSGGSRSFSTGSSSGSSGSGGTRRN